MEVDQWIEKLFQQIEGEKEAAEQAKVAAQLAEAEALKARNDAIEARNQAIREKRVSDSLKDEIQIAFKDLQKAYDNLDLANKSTRKQTAQSLALNSLGEADTVLKALLALQAFALDSDLVNEGPTQDPIVYDALYQALRSFYPTYNFYPSLWQDPAHSRVRENTKGNIQFSSKNQWLSWNPLSDQQNNQSIEPNEELITVSPSEERWVTSGNSSQTLTFYQILNGNETPIFNARKMCSKGVFFPNDEDKVVLITKDTIEIWSFAQQKRINYKPINMAVRDISIAPKGDQMILLLQNDQVDIWDIGARVKTLPNGALKNVILASYTPTGDSLVLANEDGRVSVYDRVKDRLNYFRSRHRARIIALDVSPAGDKIVTASWNKEIFIWDLKALNLPPYIQIKGLLNIKELTFHTKTRQVVVLYKNNEVRSWPWSAITLRQQLCPYLPKGRKKLSLDEWDDFIGDSSLDYQEEVFECQ